ncbi:MAG TPA: TolC family protein [Kofleriaceae bacterium]|nr:TolC family protein [Kofleriaceae bacterium]
MRFARLGVVLLALLGAPRAADADLLARAISAGEAPGGRGPAPPWRPPLQQQPLPPGQQPAQQLPQLPQPGQPPPPPQSDDLTAWAGPARPTGLPELLQHAVQHSPSLASAKIDIEIAEARIYQALARDDWQIAANLQVDNGIAFNGISFERSTSVQLGANITRPLPTGGTIGLHVGTQYSRFPSIIPGDGTQVSWSDEITGVITHPLLRGRGRFLYDAAERRATLSRDAAVLARRLAAIQAIQAVIAAYWDLVLAERQVAITRSSLDLAKERLRITQIGSDGGKVPRSEIPAVQQIIATREEDVLNGELGVLDRSISLRRAAGLPIGKGELGLRVGADLATQDAAWDLGQLTERAFSASPELAQLAKQDAITTINIEVTEDGLLPQLDAALRIGPEGQDPKFGTALKDMVTFESLKISGTLTFQHSLGQENVKGLAREQRAVKRRLEVTAFDVRAQLAQAMARAVAQAELARRRVALSQRAIDLATENIKIESDRFNLGKATNFDVLNRQEELRQAEVRKAQAIIDWHKAETIVQALTGDILPSYGVSVD